MGTTVLLRPRTGSEPVLGGRAFGLVVTTFLLWGFVTSAVDGTAPAARGIFHLSYAQQMLTRFSFFLAYGLGSIPSALLLSRIGAPRSILLALLVMEAGALLMLGGAHLGSYPAMLVALFVLAGGITLLHVAANPLAAIAGNPTWSHRRLLLAEGFNSLGTVLGPLAAAELLFRGGVFDPAVAMAEGADASADPHWASLWAIGHQFELVSAAVALVFVLQWFGRGRLRAECGSVAEEGGVLSAFRSGWGLFGGFAIFCYVGAEVSTSTLMVNFLSQPGVLGVSHARAAQLLGAVFWGGAMIGRFGGSQLLRAVGAGRLLGVCALVNIGLCLFVSQRTGVLAGAGALSLGLFDSVMFPLIFTLTLQRSGARICSLSGLMCTAIVGGAVLPPLAGLVADRSGIAAAFAVPLAGYVGVAVFAIMGRTRLMRP